MLKKIDNKGFSIIEVLIVLAIAGLIMLVVFLAVPALRLNAANNARQNDASRISAALTDCISNRNGIVTSCQTFKDPEISATDSAKVEVGQLSQLRIGDIITPGTGANAPQYTIDTPADGTAVTALNGATGNVGKISLKANNPDAVRWAVVFNSKCSDDGASVVYSTNKRDFAIVYGKGTRNSNPTPVCIGS